MEPEDCAIDKNDLLTNNSTGFDLQLLYKHFTGCLGDGEVDMKEYLNGFKELFKFFGILGSVFGFVASDVDTKTKILEGYMSGENGKHYESIKEMIEYEEKESLLRKKDFVSGCRTLLRLHRALEFVSRFLEAVVELEGPNKLTPKCQEIYSSTLAKYHPWLIQKAALLAMHALPTKDGLIQKGFGSSENPETVSELVKKTVSSMDKVYEATQQFYEQHQILDLP